jgi:YbgC/YbaW family acyl-CoA thioester hydrolase
MMAFEFRYRHRIEFAETDMAGIVHFSNYFRYMEMAEHEFFRSLGLSVHTEIDGRIVSWPRVRAECSYKGPLAFEEEVEVHLVVRKKTKGSITYDFDFRKADGNLAARGSVKVACVAIDRVTKEMSPIAIPRLIDEKIEAAPAEL